ncbi:MAG: DUF4249 domain-containing protein [Bacteroidales bacterium]|nr:DUF4249 domain-containing protein [Bacteroidales bacterium]
MKNFRCFFIFLFIPLSIIIFHSCEKDITLDIPQPEEKIVVEGWIEQDQPAFVMLSKNSAYFAVIDSAALTNMIITNAVIKVKEVETGIEEVLTLVFNPVTFPPFIYKGSTLLGKINHHYNLSIVVDGKELTATTSIPPLVSMDSVWFEPEKLLDTLGMLYFGFKDPPASGNYYRIFSKRIPQDNRFVPAWGSVYDDVYFNGQEVEYGFLRGQDNYQTVSDSAGLEQFYYKLGDTIIGKVASIDKIHFDFWKSIENAIYGGGNPFAAPATIFSNINGGLGVWGGYAAYYDTIVAVAAP